MNFNAYKLVFTGGVHFGNRNIEDSENVFHADTLFSALCHEAKKSGDEVMEELYSYVKTGKLLFSDALPYRQNTFYIPKPMIKLEYEAKGDSTAKKAFKKLSYIPAEKIDEYLKGNLDIKAETENLEHFGILDAKEMVAVRGKEESLPYRVGVFYFSEGNGLYIIVGYEEEKAKMLAEDLLDSLSYAGIGGKRSAGLGRFEFRTCKLEESLKVRLQGKGTRYMSLSVSLPKEEELERVVAGADFQMIKRSGFVASSQYADEFLRKKDLYVMNVGACFQEVFDGDVYDVASVGKHPVYRYAKPLLMEVDA